MKHNYYSISDASGMLNIEAHVLRYWEEELELDIPRNDIGHRTYRDKEINIFKQIRDYKDEGLSLLEIKKILKGNNKMLQKNTAKQPDKLDQFRMIMDSIISQAIENNNEKLISLICENTSERVIKEMNYLFRTLDEDEDIRISQLKAAITASQCTKNEIAATTTPKKKKHRFRKKKQN
ncbi:MAG: MerR family transcriptional regulator [Lachnospiraceae bacterium]|nr:MerR family transcriptional regulator [Lachnospiraceae bacterium]